MSNEELAVLIQQGQREYIPTLYDHVRKLLTSIAKRYFNKFYGPCARCGITLDDLIQETYFVMLDGARYFKPDSGNKFVSYLTYPMWNHFRKLTGCRTAKRDPLNSADSLDEPLPNADESLTLGDAVPDEDSSAGFDEIDTSMYQTELHSALEKSMEHLAPEQHTAIKCRFYESKTIEQTCGSMGCSREQVRQYEAKALRALRKPKIAKTLKPFLFDEMESEAYRGTGLTAFRDKGMSSVERTTERMDDLRKRFDDTQCLVREYLNIDAGEA